MPQLRTATAPLQNTHTHTHTHTNIHRETSCQTKHYQLLFFHCNFSNIEKILWEKNLETGNTPSVELNFPSQLKNNCHHLILQ